MNYRSRHSSDKAKGLLRRGAWAESSGGAGGGRPRGPRLAAPASRAAPLSGLSPPVLLRTRAFGPARALPGGARVFQARGLQPKGPWELGRKCNPLASPPSVCARQVASLVSGSLQPRGPQPSRLLRTSPDWVAVPCSRRCFWPRDWTRVSYLSRIGRWVLYRYCHLRIPPCGPSQILPVRFGSGKKLVFLIENFCFDRTSCQGRRFQTVGP